MSVVRNKCKERGLWKFPSTIEHQPSNSHKQYLCTMQFSSSLLENAVNEFAKLPGIGKKTALRLVLHLLKQDPGDVHHFSEVMSRMRSEIKFCQRCFNVADGDICSICANSMRKSEMICIVENIRDVIAIESTQQFNGVYHVLGGVISPLDGIGPDQLTIEALIHRIEKEQTAELIFALNPTIQGDTTIYYIQKKLGTAPSANATPLRITTIARGIAFGGELEYADEMTLARSLQNRLPVDKYVSR
ncbi:recombination mediator RecR [Terrimonas sp. NA20]|uniref:Recombination protein RecR n=1 Tax=Terrimonas ginsenosidimutans TaxID=2908004 RepID=A0ABS9KMZ3_9BACT|nr:recombination mediator RecR [Terrimonas ginsenosidimutans]MCG2613702.1 recombination mediator RecR [Terrimonas ginsenosidimutans]